MNTKLQQLLNKSERIDTSLLSQIKDCLVIAPHPDDESLGCGGLIASLRQSGIAVHVIFTTDGSMSHPESQNTTAIGRCKMREQEAINALAILGVEESRVTFFRGQDSALPAKGEKGFTGFVAQMKGIIDTIQPGLVLVPYEFDPHRDHRASWQITVEALEEYPEAAIWQYLIWLYTLGKDQDVEPLTTIPGGIQYLPMRSFKQLKKKAIIQHHSQLDLEVFEDPKGFMLKDEVLQNFYGDKEYYIKQQ
jgi:LmbE family N-acetylglucosaminyl deacetylase